MQMAVGAALGALLAVLWPGLLKGWGTMGVFAFQGGHGNAGAAGQTYENLGIPENLSVGMVLATFGLIMAMLVGMIVVNIGVRKGWTKFVKDAQKQPDWYYGGGLPEEKRSSIGSTVTSSIGINHLALQGGGLASRGGLRRPSSDQGRRSCMAGCQHSSDCYSGHPRRSDYLESREGSQT